MSTGHKWSIEARQRMSEYRKKNPTRYWLGKKRPEFSEIFREANTGRKQSEEIKKKRGLGKGGADHPRWIPDRSKLLRTSKQGERRTSAYFEWRKQVLLRDNSKCRIDNADCEGSIEVHHILNWSEYVELRYEPNNGIALCHAHHPRKRAEEKRLQPIFEALVSVSKN